MSGYAEPLFLIPDVALAQGTSLGPEDPWLPRPMAYPKFVSLLRALLHDVGVVPEVAQKATFNVLRRAMPTGADVLQFTDSMSAAVGNWQDTPKSAQDAATARFREQVA